VTELLQALLQVGLALAKLILEIHVGWLLLAAWGAWWLWGVSWKNLWPVLRQGGWAPLGLLTFIAALAWACVFPGGGLFLGMIPIGSFGWHLAYVALAVGLALFCGWLQGFFHWTPPEIELEPPPTHDHSHGHAH